MHFIQNKNIDPSVRLPPLKRYLEQLRRSLLSPAMSTEQKETIRAKIATVQNEIADLKTTP